MLNKKRSYAPDLPQCSTISQASMEASSTCISTCNAVCCRTPFGTSRNSVSLQRFKSFTETLTSFIRGVGNICHRLDTLRALEGVRRCSAHGTGLDSSITLVRQRYRLAADETDVPIASCRAGRRKLRLFVYGFHLRKTINKALDRDYDCDLFLYHRPKTCAIHVLDRD